MSAISGSCHLRENYRQCSVRAIVSLAVFWLIKALTRLHVRQEPAAAAPLRSEVVLKEIRDLLAARSAPRP
jgi:hypothetical protein